MLFADEYTCLLIPDPLCTGHTAWLYIHIYKRELVELLAKKRSALYSTTTGGVDLAMQNARVAAGSWMSAAKTTMAS